MQRKIKVRRGPQGPNPGAGSRRTPGRKVSRIPEDALKPAIPQWENFGTLTGFEASLDLLSGKSVEAPQMKGDGDGQKPGKSELSRGYTAENIDAPQGEIVPHENESASQTSKPDDARPVSQGKGKTSAKTAEELAAEEALAVDTAPGPEGVDETVTEGASPQASDSIEERLMAAVNLAQVRAQAGLVDESRIIEEAKKIAKANTLADIDRLTTEGRALLEGLNRKIAATTVTASAPAAPVIPRNVPGQVTTPPISGDQELALMFGA